MKTNKLFAALVAAAVFMTATAFVSGQTQQQQTTTVIVGGPSSNVRVVNMSSRGYVGDGDETLIPGFVTGVEGDYLIDASGAGLKAVAPVLQTDDDTSLTVYPLGSSQAIATNNDFDADPAYATRINTVRAQVGGFALGHKDSAVIVHLLPGAYTAPVTHASGNRGIAIVEVWPLAPSKKAILNVSTRGRISTGSESLIMGASFRGSGIVGMLFRGIGPTLGTYGVKGFLPDPYLTVYNSSESVQVPFTPNDNANLAGFVFSRVGAFALMVPTLDAAFGWTQEFRADYVTWKYTAVITASPNSPKGNDGKPITSGVGMGEFYLYQPDDAQ